MMRSLDPYRCGAYLLVPLLSSTLCFSIHVPKASIAHRVKRQNENSTPVTITSPSPEYVKRLENFWPQFSERCPDRHMICYDESYCFSEKQLCSGSAGPCLDSSHNINAYCMGKSTTTTERYTAGSATQPPSTTVPYDETQSQQTGQNLNVVTHLDSFSHPLVISFFVLVGGLLVYVAMATVCCVTMRMNTVTPRPLVAERNSVGAA